MSDISEPTTEEGTDPVLTEAERQDDLTQRINEDYLKPNAHQELPSDAVKRLRGELEDEEAPDDEEDDG